MKKKKRLILLAILPFLALSCCSHNISSPSSATGSSQLSKSIVSTSSLKFDKYIGDFGISLNSDLGDDRYLFFYGTLTTTETDTDRLANIYKDKYSMIDMYYKGEKMYSSKDLDWIFSKAESKNMDVTLMVPCQLKQTVKQFEIDKIVLYSKEANKVFEIGKYNVSFFKTAETQKLTCVEAPIANPNPDLDLTLSYAVMMTEKTNSQKFNFRLEMPVSSDTWEIVNTDWLYDDDLTQQFKLQYSSIKTEDEMKYLKVYRLNVHFKLKSKTNIIFKPIISADIDGEKEYCASVPFVIKFKK